MKTDKIMKTYDSVLLAQYMLSLAHSKGINLNVTKVQKLIYIVYGVFMSEHDHQITTEAPKAWPFGPVFPRSQKKVNYTAVMPLDTPLFGELKEDKILNDVLGSVIDKFANLSATSLSEWSHQEGGPWHRTVSGNNKWNAPIPNQYIKEYFEGIDV